MSEAAGNIPKSERIKLLRRLGINTPDYTSINDKDELFDFQSCVGEKETWSIRSSVKDTAVIKENDEGLFNMLHDIIDESFHGNVAPSFPPNIFGLPSDYVVATIDVLLEAGLNVIVAPGMNPKDCIFAGCIMLRDGDIILEAAEKAHVRKITRDGEIDFRVITNRFSWKYPVFHKGDVPGPERISRVKEVIAEALRLPLVDVILEFSYYNVPIGWNEQGLIFWDFTDADEYHQE